MPCIHLVIVQIYQLSIAKTILEDLIRDIYRAQKLVEGAARNLCKETDVLK